MDLIFFSFFVFLDAGFVFLNQEINPPWKLRTNIHRCICDAWGSITYRSTDFSVSKTWSPILTSQAYFLSPREQPELSKLLTVQNMAFSALAIRAGHLIWAHAIDKGQVVSRNKFKHDQQLSLNFCSPHSNLFIWEVCMLPLQTCLTHLTTKMMKPNQSSQWKLVNNARTQVNITSQASEMNKGQISKTGLQPGLAGLPVSSSPLKIPGPRQETVWHGSSLKIPSCYLTHAWTLPLPEWSSMGGRWRRDDSTWFSLLPAVLLFHRALCPRWFLICCPFGMILGVMRDSWGVARLG